MTKWESQLLDILRDRSFKRGQFVLASGGTSNYYIDARMTTISSEGAFLIGGAIYERTKDLDIQAIGGLQVGAVPLVTATVIMYSTYDQDMEGFWVRNTTKDHGTKKIIEGKLEPGMKVAIVEDVITKGESTLKAVNAVRDHGCEIISVISLVDRLQGGRELLEENGVDNYQSIFTIKDFN